MLYYLELWEWRYLCGRLFNTKCLGCNTFRIILKNWGIIWIKTMTKDKNYDKRWRFLLSVMNADTFLLYHRVLALVEKEVCSLTLDDISRQCAIPSTYTSSGRQIDKIIARGKLERSIQVPQNSSCENQYIQCWSILHVWIYDFCRRQKMLYRNWNMGVPLMMLKQYVKLKSWGN